MGGLIEGATVRLAGVQIGRVTSVGPPAPARRQGAGDDDRRATLRRQGPAQLRGAHRHPGPARATRSSRSPSARRRRPRSSPATCSRLASPSRCRRCSPPERSTLGQVNQLAVTLRQDRGPRRTGSPTRSKKARAGSTCWSTRSRRALRRLNALMASTQQMLARAESDESAVGVLLSHDSGKSVRSLLAALDALGRAAQKPEADGGLLPTLLFDPQYRTVARDLQVLDAQLPRRIRQARARAGHARRHAQGRP